MGSRHHPRTIRRAIDTGRQAAAHGRRWPCAPSCRTPATAAGRSGTSDARRSLVDVEDVALGHESKMRWNPTSQWVWSEHQTHPAIIDSNAFEAAQDIFASAQRKRSARNAHAIRRSSQAWSAARSAAGRCKGRGTTARRTTDASSRPSTPSPRANTASATPSLLATGSSSNRTPTSRSPQPGSPRSNVTAEFSRTTTSWA
jgi:hypothetical protein